MFILCFAAALLPTSQKKTLSKSDLEFLFKPAFENFRSVDSTNLNLCCDYGRVRYGDDQYYEGLKGIFLYGGDARKGVIDLLGQKENASIKSRRSSGFYDISIYEELVGTNLFVSKNSQAISRDGSFERYNPEFINWVVENVISDSEFSISGISAQYVYRHYSRFFHLLTESYLYLQKSGTYDEQAEYYITDVEKNGQDGLDVLFGTYHYALSDYELPSGSPIPSPFEAHMAFGFWLRRNLDGTHDEIYAGLSKVMKRFDKKWFKSVKAKYEQ